MPRLWRPCHQGATHERNRSPPSRTYGSLPCPAEPPRHQRPIQRWPPHCRRCSPKMPPAELPARKRWLALAVLCVTVLVANLDSTVLNVTLPTLVRDLSATSGDLQWIVDSYIVVFAGSLLAAGSLADRIGRKRTLLAGLAVFAGGSAWAAFSGDVGTLIAARASMGIGGALMIPSTVSIISNMFRDPAERQRAIGRWGGTSGIGVALGPISGGSCWPASGGARSS